MGPLIIVNPKGGGGGEFIKFYIGKLYPKTQTLTLEYVNLYQNGTPFIQWNSDFSNTRLFETPDSSNQKSFPLDLLQSNAVILPPIFRNSRYFELILSSLH